MQEMLFFLVKSLNPFNYKELINAKKRKVVLYFFLLILASVLLNAALQLPGWLNHDKTLANLESFNISGLDIRLHEPVVLLNTPRTVLDLTENKTISNEIILITEDQIFLKKLSPDLKNRTLTRTEARSLDEYSDLKTSFQTIKGLYWIVLLLLLPTILLIMLILNYAKYSIMLGIFIAVCSIILFLRKKRFSPSRLFRICVFALTPMVIGDLLVGAVFELGALPLLYSVAILGVNIWYHR